jgi:Transposase, Mutator family
MRRTIDATNAPSLVLTAQQTSCLVCQGPVHICHHRRRVVVRLDGPYRVIRRDKRCPDSECAGHSTLYRPIEDIRLALPYKMFGLDVICWVGQQHLGRSLSLRQIGRDLNDKKVPIDQTHVGELLRDYLALCQLSHPAEAVLQKLRAQGGIVLMVDGVQHDDRSPVLYLVWDALSGTPLLGERKEYRGEGDLVVLLEQVKKLDIPVLAVVSDKERGLFPAVQRVFPGVPYQLCQTHFLKNCAKPMETDLVNLGQSVERRVQQVRKLDRKIHRAAAKAAKASDSASESSASATPPSVPEPVQARATPPSVPEPVQARATPPSVPEPVQARATPPSAPAPLTEAQLVHQFSELSRLNARVRGRAPLAPAPLERPRRLEQIRAAVQTAREKKTAPPLPCSMS